MSAAALQSAASLAQAGRAADAIATLREAIAADGNNAQAHALLGTLLHSSGRTPEALRALHRAHTLAPEDARITYQYGAVLATSGEPRRGLDLMQRAVDLDPTWVQGAHGFANFLSSGGDFARADAVYRRALEINPSSAELLCGRAGLLVVSGRPQQAVSLFRRADECHPNNADVLGRLVSALNYADDASRQEVFDAHVRWGRAVMADAEPPPAWPNDRDPERRLRIGLLSPDLYDHSCAYFLRSILKHRPREQVEVYCYSTAARSDWMTDRLKADADHWRAAANLPERRLLELLRADALDILVELSGHTAMGPLATLRHRAAPVQATYLGYPNTTGLPTIDYRIVDPHTDLDGAEPFHTERLLRLPGCFLCYTPAEFAPEPTATPVPTYYGAPPPPAPPRTGPITFASFNSIRKLSPTTIRLWAGILNAVPDSTLLIKTRGAATALARQHLTDQFREHGVDPDRLSLSEMVPDKAEHLAWYRRVDIALDTFPYNGTTTTCEALWMGVPVVTLAGDRHASRVGLSLLTAAGLSELVASSEADYIAIATRLAADRERLAAWRTGLREQLRASALMNGPAHATAFFAALRDAWRAWCAAS